MARTASSAALTANNRIYLYRLLSHELGCGKQTFLPAVEAALESDRMTADDLGYESTRELLEALGEFVKLTVFKGGRIYATIIAQPVWDEALAALDDKGGKGTSAGPSNKPWKRKKADKALKPVRPKRVKRAAPEPAPEPESVPEPAPDSAATSSTEPEPMPDSAATSSTEPEPMPGSETASGSVELDAKSELTSEVKDRAGVGHGLDLKPAARAQQATEPAGSTDGDGEARRETTTGAESAAAVSPIPPSPAEPEPAISLTVVYDPYSGVDRETTIQSHPVSAKPAAHADTPAEAPSATPRTDAARTASARPAATVGHHEPSPATSATEAPRPKAPAEPVRQEMRTESATAPIEPATPAPAQAAPKIAPEVLATYPTDLSTEVYLPSERIADLCELLPYGTDVFALLAEDYARARALELIEGTRARAVFPLRIQHADSVEPIKVALKRRSGAGLKWELSSTA